MKIWTGIRGLVKTDCADIRVLVKVRDWYEMGGKVLKYQQSTSKIARLLLETGEGAGLVSERW